MSDEKEPTPPNPSEAPANAAGDAPPPEDEARNAGRGGLVIVAAKILFIVYGVVQQILLQYLLGKAGYGEVSFVNASVSVVNNVMVAASIQGVSRTVASAPTASAGELYRRVLGYHAVIAVIIAAVFAGLAGVIAGVFHAEHVTTPLRVAALIVLLYGIYAPIVGSLNGRKRFLDQGGLDIVYGALRTVGIVSGAFLFQRASGSGTLGFVVGVVGAAVLILPASVWRAGLGKKGGNEPTLGKYLGFLLPVVIAQGFLNLLLRTDFFALRYFAGEKAAAQGVPQAIADGLLGVYQGMQIFAFLPFQLLMSITFILFPLLARAHADGDSGSVRDYTRAGVRLSFVFTGLVCGTVSALPMHMLRLTSPEEIWQNGAGALRILAIGMAPLSILGISSAVLTSLRREGAAAGITAAAVAFVAIVCVVLLPGAPLDNGMLVRTAIAASVGLFAAMVIGAVFVKRTAGGFVPVLTAVRVPIAIAAAVAAGWKMPWLGKVAVLPQAAAIGAVYVVVLVLTREVGGADLAIVKRALLRRKKA